MLRESAPVSFFLPNLDGGGAERVALNLAVGFAARGFRTDLVLASASGPYLSEVPDTVRVVDLRAPRVLRSLPALVKYLRRERPAVILSALDHANLVAMAATRLARVRTRAIVSVHCTFEKSLGHHAGLRERAIPWLLGRLHWWADSIVAVSEGVADDLARAACIPRGRVNVIYNPVIMPTLPAVAAEPAAFPWFNDPTHPVVLGVGRLTPQKNFALLIDAFAHVRRQSPARLVILGEGPERSALESRIRALDLSRDVQMPGFTANPYACMARAGVFVLSSDFEGLPTALIESLALGTPVVSTDCPSGPREILRGGTLGELVPMGDVGALASAIARALTAPRQRPEADALGSYTLDAAVDRFLSVCHLHA